MNISINRLLATARDLTADSVGDNPEYDRALVELTSDLLGIDSDLRYLVRHALGVVLPEERVDASQHIEGIDLPVYETSDDDLPTKPSRAATSTEFYFDTEADMAGYCGVKTLDYYGNKPVWARAHGGDCAGRMGEVTVSYNGQPPQMFAWPVMCETHFNEMLGNPV